MELFPSSSEDDFAPQSDMGDLGDLNTAGSSVVCAFTDQEQTPYSHFVSQHHAHEEPTPAIEDRQDIEKDAVAYAESGKDRVVISISHSPHSASHDKPIYDVYGKPGGKGQVSIHPPNDKSKFIWYDVIFDSKGYAKLDTNVQKPDYATTTDKPSHNWAAYLDGNGDNVIDAKLPPQSLITPTTVAIGEPQNSSTSQTPSPEIALENARLAHSLAPEDRNVAAVQPDSVTSQSGHKNKHRKGSAPRMGSSTAGEILYIEPVLKREAERNKEKSLGGRLLDHFYGVFKPSVHSAANKTDSSKSASRPAHLGRRDVGENIPKDGYYGHINQLHQPAVTVRKPGWTVTGQVALGNRTGNYDHLLRMVAEAPNREVKDLLQQINAELRKDDKHKEQKLRILLRLGGTNTVEGILGGSDDPFEKAADYAFDKNLHNSLDTELARSGPGAHRFAAYKGATKALGKRPTRERFLAVWLMSRTASENYAKNPLDTFAPLREIAAQHGFANELADALKKDVPDANTRWSIYEDSVRWLNNQDNHDTKKLNVVIDLIKAVPGREEDAYNKLFHKEPYEVVIPGPPQSVDLCWEGANGRECMPVDAPPRKETRYRESAAERAAKAGDFGSLLLALPYVSTGRLAKFVALAELAEQHGSTNDRESLVSALPFLKSSPKDQLEAAKRLAKMNLSPTKLLEVLQNVESKARSSSLVEIVNEVGGKIPYSDKLVDELLVAALSPAKNIVPDRERAEVVAHIFKRLIDLDQLTPATVRKLLGPLNRDQRLDTYNRFFDRAGLRGQSEKGVAAHATMISLLTPQQQEDKLSLLAEKAVQWDETEVYGKLIASEDLAPHRAKGFARGFAAIMRSTESPGAKAFQVNRLFNDQPTRGRVELLAAAAMAVQARYTQSFTAKYPDIKYRGGQFQVTNDKDFESVKLAAELSALMRLRSLLPKPEKNKLDETLYRVSDKIWRDRRVQAIPNWILKNPVRDSIAADRSQEPRQRDTRDLAASPPSEATGASHHDGRDTGRVAPSKRDTPRAEIDTDHAKRPPTWRELMTEPTRSDRRSPQREAQAL